MVLEKDEHEQKESLKYVDGHLLVRLNIDIQEEHAGQHKVPESLWKLTAVVKTLHPNKGIDHYCTSVYINNVHIYKHSPVNSCIDNNNIYRDGTKCTKKRSLHISNATYASKGAGSTIHRNTCIYLMEPLQS